MTTALALAGLLSIGTVAALTIHGALANVAPGWLVTYAMCAAVIWGTWKATEGVMPPAPNQGETA